MKMKTVPEDFLVHEVLTLNYIKKFEEQPYMIFSLSKKGYTTFQAVDIMSEFFEIPREEITYAGLKDEDGVTFQKACIPSSYKFIEEKLGQFNEDYSGSEKYISLTTLGFSKHSIHIGGLEGNAFQLKLRDMDQETAEKYCMLKKYALFFPNYYDTQRFGIPNEKKVTHLIGKALIENNYEEAYKYLKISNTPEAYLELNSDYKSFFDSLDARKVSFYYNSYMSYLYNQDLANLIRIKGSSVKKEYDGIAFELVADRNTALKLYENEMIEITRYYGTKDGMETRLSARQSVQETQISFIRCEEDEIYPGKYCMTIAFILPSGTYATMAMKQLKIMLENKNGLE